MAATEKEKEHKAEVDTVFKNVGQAHRVWDNRRKVFEADVKKATNIAKTKDSSTVQDLVKLIGQGDGIDDLLQAHELNYKSGTEVFSHVGLVKITSQYKQMADIIKQGNKFLAALNVLMKLYAK